MPGIEGNTLREWRRARGWDVPQLARQLRRAATEPIAAHDGLVRMIRSWERGAHALSERYELLYRSLGFGAASAGAPSAIGASGVAASAGVAGVAGGTEASAPGQCATLVTADSPAAETDSVEVCCRTPDGRIMFVPLSHVTPDAAISAAVPAVPRPRPVPALDEARPAQRFQAARRALRDNDNLFGPRDVIPLAVRQLADIREASRSLHGADRRELLLPQIQFADLLGWLYQDCCAYDEAGRWLDRALEWAHALGDDCRVAFVLARKSQLACDRQDSVTAIAAAGAAIRLSDDRHPLTAAAAAAYGGHGHALAGDAAAARRLYGRARTSLSSGPLPADWATFVDPSYIDVYEAWSLAALGDHAAAASRFSAAIRGLRPCYHRDRGVYLAREARSRALSGDHGRAAELASQALAIGTETGSARIFSELAAVRGLSQVGRESGDLARFHAMLAAAQR